MCEHMNPVFKAWILQVCIFNSFPGWSFIIRLLCIQLRSRECTAYNTAKKRENHQIGRCLAKQQWQDEVLNNSDKSEINQCLICVLKTRHTEHHAVTHTKTKIVLCIVCWGWDKYEFIFVILGMFNAQEWIGLSFMCVRILVWQIICAQLTSDESSPIDRMQDLTSMDKNFLRAFIQFSIHPTIQQKNHSHSNSGAFWYGVISLLRIANVDLLKSNFEADAIADASRNVFVFLFSLKSWKTTIITVCQQWTYTCLRRLILFSFFSPNSSEDSAKGRQNRYAFRCHCSFSNTFCWLIHLFK